MFKLVKKRSNISPQYVTAILGESVQIECYSSSPVLWFFNNGYLPSGVAKKKTRIYNTILIEHVYWTHSGTFQCYGELIDEGKFFAESQVKVISKEL